MSGQADATDALSARFELGDKLGGGRTGVVVRAKDKQGGAAVAVKIVSPAVLQLPGVAQRLERELKHIEKVASPGVAKVLASGKQGEDAWVAMELLEGAQTLAAAIGARGPIALDFAAHLIEVIGEALIEAAQVGVVHRDLAPKNVLFAGSEIKLVNFSLPTPTTSAVPGVPEFVAPEQVEGKPVDQRSNLYSLGALYYYVLTGQPPYTGSVEEVHRGHTSGTIKPPSQLAAVPAPVEAAILRALDRSPTKRFLTVRQFVDEVSRIARGDASSPGSTQPMGKIGRPKAELVQTLLGVRGMGGAALGAAISNAPTVGAGVPAIVPASHA
ncbi:MAG: serine/threonine-protein kinase, partial [Proteobacteria bacterium]|nr:serine/threonine-protein kinase [Pseudomonadota bacterium]